MKQAVLTIWIPNQKFVKQGKYCLIDGKPCFIANMTEAKWFRIYAGYGIAKRILDALPRGTKIIYKRVDLGTSYETNKTKFQKKGILVSFGGHSQWVLPLKNWKVIKGMPVEPHQLPVITLDQWLKKTLEVQNVSIHPDVMLRLGKEFKAKYA